MNKKDFYRIINEEIAKFDFLGNDLYLKEQSELKRIADEDFQKQFIIDSITNMKNKILLDNTDATVNNEPNMKDGNDHYDLDIDYLAGIQYKVNSTDNPYHLKVLFNADDIHYNTDFEEEEDTMEVEGSMVAWYDLIDWFDIDVSLYDRNGEEIEFIAFNNAPNNIKTLFIRSYVEPVIEKHSAITDVREKLPQYTPFE